MPINQGCEISSLPPSEAASIPVLPASLLLAPWHPVGFAPSNSLQAFCFAGCSECCSLLAGFPFLGVSSAQQYCCSLPMQRGRAPAVSGMTSTGLVPALCWVPAGPGTGAEWVSTALCKQELTCLGSGSAALPCIGESVGTLCVWLRGCKEQQQLLGRAK